MRPKSLVLLGLALGCGLIASIGISQVLDRQKTAPQKTEAIYVAKVDLNLGDIVTPEMVNLEQWPVDKIPIGAIRNLDDFEGQRVKGKIFSGEPVLEARVGATADAVDTIPEGYNAFAVQLGKAEIGAGLLRPGNRVDVQWYVKKNQAIGIQQTITKKILYNVRVFAVDQQFERSAEEGEQRIGSIITLLLTPDDTDKIALAQQLGAIKLVLRNSQDGVDHHSDGVTVAELFEDSKAGDVEAERASVKKTAKKDSQSSSFLDFMDKARQMAATAASAMPDNDPREKAWVVEIIEADVVRQEFFDSHGQRIASGDGMDREYSKSDSDDTTRMSDDKSSGTGNDDRVDSGQDSGFEEYIEATSESRHEG